MKKISLILGLVFAANMVALSQNTNDGQPAPPPPPMPQFSPEMFANMPPSMLVQMPLEFLENLPAEVREKMPKLKAENLAKTPQLGWNSWNTFATNISEELVKGIADAFVSLGLKDAGYEYIVLDDGWMAMERDAQGNLTPHPDKFPNGIKAVADYVHSKGLKFGLYNCAGSKTCAGYPGSRGHEYQDALKYAEWGVDYLKYDWCNVAPIREMADKITYAREAYSVMAQALLAAGRPVLFSLCEWGDNDPWKWASFVGHSWRTTGDISNCFDCIENHGSWNSWGVMQILNMRDQETLRKAAGPGHWNDMDMMEVGNEGLSLYENQSHFALWAVLNSPLILGNDIRSMSKETLAVLTNKDIIALNQDTLGIQGFQYKTINDSIDIWAKPLAGDEWALLFLNRSTTPAEFTFDWSTAQITDTFFNKEILFSKTNVYKIKDLFAGKELGDTKKPLKANLDKHQSLVIRLKK
ncbi:MAG: glycoside hydrolase family 27 protein [Dysgonamonadaceae bacterium]|jgi:alpha-galactosidase|nr:glycoside hydrolase family 27 protein [Dysgonamonadaceae bacterium]